MSGFWFGSSLQLCCTAPSSYVPTAAPQELRFITLLCASLFRICHTGSARPPRGPNPPPGGPQKDPEGGNSRIKNYLIAGAFFIGMGTGVWFDSGASFTPSNIASTELVDRKTPNSEICISSGYSSMVFDQRIFVSFNPCAPL